MRTHSLLAVLCLGAWVADPSAARADTALASLDDSTLVALAVALGAAPAPDLGDAGGAGVSAPSVVQLTARVHASALVFSAVPRVRVAFGGAQRTMWSSERVNLPTRITPGVVYRDVEVRLTVSGAPEDLMTLLADARSAARDLRLEQAQAAVATAPAIAAPASVAPAAPSGAPATTALATVMPAAPAPIAVLPAASVPAAAAPAVIAPLFPAAPAANPAPAASAAPPAVGLPPPPPPPPPPPASEEARTTG